jgi:hypothetical protein
MVGQVVAGAVAPVVVQSATSEDGLINKLFKIALLLGVLGVIAVVVAIALYITNTDLREAVSGFFRAPFELLAGALPFGVSTPFRILQVGLTGITSAFAFRRS